MKNFFKQNWVLFAILILALFFRFFLLNHYPGGLFPDEAANGLDINTMFHGQIQPFYERGNGREALFFYFEALSVLIFGRGVWQFHIVSAAFGFASVVALYFLAKRLFDKRTALLAAFFLAISSYAVTVTRTAFRATMVPFVTTMVVFFLVKFFQETEPRKKYWAATLAGLFFAIGFYTYTSYRSMLPLVVGFAVLLLLANRSRLMELYRLYKGYTWAFIGAFVAGIAWIAVWFIQHPGDFVGRAGEVSVFNPDLNHGHLIQTFIMVVKQTLLSFFTAGDLNWRQNVSGYPFLSPFLSAFFGVIAIWFTISAFRLIKQIWQQQVEPALWWQGFLAVWFWFMIVPEISTAEGIPHGLRLIGTIPPMFLMSAFGVNWLWVKLENFAAFRKFGIYFAAVFLVGLFIYNYNLYFAVAVNSPDYYYAYRSDLTDVSNYLSARNDKAQTYLVLDAYSVQTTDYLTSGENDPYMLLDPATSWQQTLKSGDQIVFTQSTLYDSTNFEMHHPDAKLVRLDRNQFGDIIMIVFTQP